MTTTTLRLPDGVKSRIDKLAAAAGKTAHAFMVEALAESVDVQERQQDFDAEVTKRWAHFKRTGHYLTIDDLRTYAVAVARGEKPPPPKPRKMPGEQMASIRALDRKPRAG